MSFPFSNLTGRGVAVAVIDSGIVPDHPKVGPLTDGVSISVGKAGDLIYGSDFEDCVGHGTACAGIIRRKAMDASIYSIRVFDESLSTEPRLLIAAIEWTVAHGIDIVNLSLGTTDIAYRDELANVCRNAVSVGTLLVASANNEGRDSYPALLADVIGVGSGALLGPYDYYYRAGRPIECIARGDPQRVCWLEPKEIMMGGTSFAAPHITGLIALIRQAYPGACLQQIREILSNHAVSETAPPLVTNPASSIKVPSAAEDRFSWIRKACLYPYNKEMHAVVRANDLLGFQVVGISDPVGKGLVGSDAGEAIGLCNKGLRITSRLSACLEHADTLILGYVDELSRIRKSDFLRKCVQVALDNEVNVFSLLALPHAEYGDLHEVAASKGLRLYYPELSFEEASRTVDGCSSLPEVDVPVLAIVGTSSQQGKFTLQLAFRRRLLELGFRIAQIGTEHHSELFGMDYGFPMGYAPSVRIPTEYYIPFLDAKMREICYQTRPHLILVGTQSGTVPYDVCDKHTLTLPTIAFLMGVKPDACILVVNSVDPEDYIQDTINGIRAFCHAPTLLLATSDFEKGVQARYGRTSIRPRPLTQAEVACKLGQLERSFGLPAICISSAEGIQKAVDVAIDHFTEDKKNGWKN